MALFHVLKHVPTADPVTGEPIDPRFTGRDITTIISAYRSKEEAERIAEVHNSNKPTWVSKYSIREASAR